MSVYEGVGFNNSLGIPDDLFILNPSHQKMMTGKRNYRYLWNRFGGAGLIVCFFIGFALLISLPELIIEVRLATSKTGQANGQVADHRASRGSKSTSYYVTYTYLTNDHTYKHEAQVNGSEYQQYIVGSSFPVTFLASDPNVSHIGVNGIRWNAILSSVLIPVVFLLVLIIWQITALPQYFRIRRMRRDGHVLLGQLKGTYGALVRRGSGKGRHTDYDVTVYYQFTNPSERKIEGNTTFVRNDLKKDELPQSGSVAILYVSDTDYMVL